jgi:lysophospholipase L1-like esterase
MSKPEHLKNILLVLFLSLILLLVLEGGVRAWKTIRVDFRTWDRDYFVGSTDLGWEHRPDYSGISKYEAPQKPIERNFDKNGFNLVDTEQVSNNKVPKIIAIGDSCTFGYGVASESTYVEFLDNFIPEASVINLGCAGYTSYQGYLTLLKKGLALKPSLIIVSFNYNDRRYVLREKDIDNESKFEKIGKNLNLSRILNKIYLYWFYKSFTRKPKKKINIRSLHARVPPENYRRNLEKMVILANERNIPMIFILLRDNPNENIYLTRGIEMLEEKNYESAIVYLEFSKNKNHTFSALARKYLAIAYEANGLSKKAKKVLMTKPSISLHGGLPIHLDTEYNEIMRDVAKEYHIEVVDAKSVLNQTPSLFYTDACHFNENAHKIIAKLIYKVTAKFKLAVRK